MRGVENGRIDNEMRELGRKGKRAGGVSVVVVSCGGVMEIRSNIKMRK